MKIEYAKNRFIPALFCISLVSCGGSGSSSSEFELTPTPPPNDVDISEVDISEEPRQFNVEQITFVKSDEDIANPGRGFYQHFETTTQPYISLNINNITPNGSNYQASDSSYTAKSTLILRAIILDDFVNTAILPDDLLNNIQADFDVAKEAGVKMIIRFYYHQNITVPYGDPEKEIILAHIEQLTPILTNNAEVILAVQQGFIGAFGEQFFTENFSPAGNVFASYTDQNWLDRNEVLRALLDGTANSTMIQVRTPQAKQKFIYGINAQIIDGAAGTENSLTEADAFSSDDIARIGFHNDCFLTDETDTGTFIDYGTSGRASANNGNAVELLKNYHKNDSQYVVIGGETCADESFTSPPISFDNDCNDGVVNTMDEFNYSYLNADFNNTVNNDWTEGDDACIESIKNRLGYRLALTEANIVTSAKAGNSIPLLLTFDNDGFTSVLTEMELRLILKNVESGLETTIVLDRTRNDIRTWQPGTININENIKLPDDLPIGDYSLFLHIADIANNGVISARPEYSIQLANNAIWNELTGYNSLEHTISVEAFVEGDANNATQ